jgi:hypothetical protein
MSHSTGNPTYSPLSVTQPPPGSATATAMADARTEAVQGGELVRWVHVQRMPISISACVDCLAHHKPSFLSRSESKRGEPLRKIERRSGSKRALQYASPVQAVLDEGADLGLDDVSPVGDFLQPFAPTRLSRRLMPSRAITAAQVTCSRDSM